MRQYSINLPGRVKNLPLPKNRPLIPLFEAIVNSLHAIEERKREDAGFPTAYIEIEIVRSNEPTLYLTELAPVDGFIIRDNGIGFNETNVKSFLESDSVYKSNIGGKGVGRFSWLKVFYEAEISSIFKTDDTFLKREFIFSLRDPYFNDILTEHSSATDCLTTVRLKSYLKDYTQDVPKQIETIAMKIVQHCLIYFLDPDCPKIEMIDTNQRLNLNQLFKDKFKPEENSACFNVGDHEFQLLNIKITEKSFKGNRLYLCANNRLVKSYDLESLIVNLDRQIYE